MVENIGKFMEKIGKSVTNIGKYWKIRDKNWKISENTRQILENIGKYRKSWRALKIKNRKNSIAINEFVAMPKVRDAQIADRRGRTTTKK